MTAKSGFVRFFVTAAAITLLVLLCNVRASAASGASANGAQLPDYESGREVNVVDDYDADPDGKEDSTKAIQKALNVGKKKASSTKRVVVRVPAGTYKITEGLKIYSNTQLILDDNATILKCYDSGSMLRNVTDGSGGYLGSENILIEGGTWDGNTSNYNEMYAFSNIRIAHANNVIVRDVNILNNKNSHHLEIGGVQGLTVEGCYFDGYTGSLVKEAIQLDVMNCSSLFSGYEPFDDTACDNVIITNCTFKNIPRGIGSHSAVAGVYYTNISITNNTFVNMADVAMILYNYKHCTVSGNKITESGAGITFNYMTDETFRHFFVPVSGLSWATDKINSDADTVIQNNTIKTQQTTQRFSPYGIKIYGANVSKATSDYPAANYSISNIKISGNTLTTVDSAIIMQDVYDSEVSGNNISVNTDAGGLESQLVLADDCQNIDFMNNDISGSLKSGISAKNGSGFTITGNTFSSNAGVGVLLTAAQDSAVSKNSFSENGLGAVKIGDGCYSITSSGNVINQSGGYGIKVSESGKGKDIKLKSNDIAGADTGIYCASDGYAYLAGNSFEAVGDKVYAAKEGLVTLVKAKNFTAEEVTDNRIKITWNAISEADGIGVYRRRAGSDEYELIATVDSGSIYQDEELFSGTNYFYKVVPFVEIGNEKSYNTESGEIEARTKINISAAYIDCVDEAGFTSKPVTPVFTVVANRVQLTAGIDYDYEYSGNLYTGTATITVTGRGNYIGKLTSSYEISLTAAKLTDTASRSQITVQCSPLKNQSKRIYVVKCTPASTELLANSNLKTNAAQRSIDAITLQVPVRTAVTTGIWTGSGYDFY